MSLFDNFARNLCQRHSGHTNNVSMCLCAHTLLLPSAPLGAHALRLVQSNLLRMLLHPGNLIMRQCSQVDNSVHTVGAQTHVDTTRTTMTPMLPVDQEPTYLYLTCVVHNRLAQ
jgi:hypothetical protein